MPRGQKSKLRSRAKRQQARDEAQSLRGAQATAEEEGSPPSSPVGVPQEAQGAPPSSSLDTGLSSTISEVGAENADADADADADAGASGGGGGDGGEESSSGPEAAPTPRVRRDPIARKASLLMEYLLEKFKMKEPVTEADMLKVINKKYKVYLPEILRRTTERLELVFGVELKKASPSAQSYNLVSKLALSSEGSLSGSKGLPKTGLLMTLLGVIFMKGNRATEQEIWEFLNVLGVYAGRRHLIFGEPRKLITKDLVQEEYLEYRQVPDSDPPSYEFLWGPRAHAETSKMKVLEVLAKINDTIPNSFPNLYEEALEEERERALSGAGAVGRARAGYKALSHSSSQI